MKKLKILCIDIEGGHGGSSRSLFYSLEPISKNKKFSNLDITVICGKSSWMETEYKRLGINCLIEKNIPRFTPLEKFSRNVYQMFLFLFILWPNSYKFRKRLLDSKQFDIIHFNHISLSFLSRWCAINSIGKKQIMHFRTLPPKNFFTKLLYKNSKKYCDSFLYITENEKNHLHSILGKPNLTEKVIYNPIKVFNKKKSVLFKNEKRFKIGILSNYSYSRGIDRTLEIYDAIPEEKKRNFLFIIAGDMTLKKNFLNLNIKNKKSFSEVVNASGYGDSFKFLGLLKYPEEFLRNINVLLKPTRQNNPWGRDILEALSLGKPAISIGSYDKFIENNVTGFLQRNYNAKEIANWLVDLETNKNLQKKLSRECKKRVTYLCSPSKVSKEILNTWITK